MAKLNLGGLSLDVNTIGWAITSYSAPGLAKGALLNWVKNKSASQIFQLSKEWQDWDVWQLLDDEWKENLVLVQEKTGVLDKLTVGWTINALKKERPDLASLILNSKEVQAFIKKALRQLRQGVKRFSLQQKAGR